MGQIGFTSGFAFESSFGPFNHELFIPWAGGGFAHYWRDRATWDTTGWQGPVILGSGNMTSLAVHEGDYNSGDNDDHHNFEMLAVEDGRVAHWFRSNLPPYDWNRTGYLPGITTAVTCALGRSHEAKDSEGNDVHNVIYAIVALQSGGLVKLVRQPDMVWGILFPLKESLNTVNWELIAGNFVGVGWALGTMGSLHVDFNDTRGTSSPLLVATTELGVCETRDTNRNGYVAEPSGYDWSLSTNLGPGLSGRPCAIQSDRGLRVPLLGPNHRGNYELLVPNAGGGISHYWSDNNNSNSSGFFVRNWNFGALVGDEKYDQVSVFQSSDLDKAQYRTPPLQLFAWRQGEAWVHHFWQVHIDNSFFWHGPLTIGFRGRTDIDPIPWEITCVDVGFTSADHKHKRWVHAVGGIRNGRRWHMTKDEVILEINSGRKRFISVGVDGSSAPVYVVNTIDPNAGVFHPFLTTAMDRKPTDNLLHLPACPAP